MGLLSSVALFYEKDSCCLTIGLLLHVPISCGCDDCGCNGPIVTTIKSMDALVGIYHDNHFTFTETSRDYRLSAIAISVSETEALEANHHASFSLIGSAFACSPAIRPAQTLTSIRIISENPLFSHGLTYSKGQLLNELFYIQEEWRKFTFEGFLKEQERFDRGFGEDGQQLVFRLYQKPNSIINQHIMFTITFDDSSEFVMGTGEFKVD